MQFDFGANWLRFSANALNSKKIAFAKADFHKLLDGLSLSLYGKSFLDIGFGQGLSLLCAAEKGAKVVGNDINPNCWEALKRSSVFFSDLELEKIPIIIGSILDQSTISRLTSDTNNGLYDIVHSWGVLHHTGDMWRGIEVAAGLVKYKGYLIIALYNRHWSSPAWKLVKRFFAHSPRWLQNALGITVYPAALIGRALVTQKNPFIKDRGMDFWYDIIDWMGGYPYEYATSDEVCHFLKKKKFKLMKLIPSEMPTGCNQFVFKKTGK